MLFLNKLLYLMGAALYLLWPAPARLMLWELMPCEGWPWLSSVGVQGMWGHPSAQQGCECVLAMLLDPGAGRRLLSGNMEQTRELMFNSCSELC